MSEDSSTTHAKRRSPSPNRRPVDLHLIETSEEQSLLIDNVRTWAESTIKSHTQHWDEEQELPAKVLREAEELGLYAIAVKESHGGFDMGFEAAISAVELLAQYEPSLALKIAILNGPVASLWPEELTLDEATWATGQLQVNGMGATGQLSDVAWGESAKWLLVPQGDRLYVIDLQSDRVHKRSQRDRLGLRCADWVDMQLDGAPTLAFPLSRSHQLTAQAWMNLGWAAIALGAGAGGLQQGLQYASERKQFGQAISEFQAIQWMIADSVTELDAARLLTYEATRALISNEEWSVREGVRLAAQARLLAAEAGHQACDRALQMHGGYGYTREYLVEKYWRDVQRTYPSEGTDLLHRLILNGLNQD